MTIGRAPQSDVFLDDITVSREHAVLEQRAGRPPPHRPGSLNGTYVNRERVEDARLGDGDELQIGKYRLAYIERLSISASRTLTPRPSRLTIGAVCRMLGEEFPDISISKIRFLEDQKLITPAADAGRLPACSARTTSSSCARSCACSATSSCRSA